jgi:CBS domain-containing protein
MALFRKILAPTDQSPAGTLALTQAARLAAESGAQLLVLHAVNTARPPAETGNIWGSGETTDDRLRKEILAPLQKLDQARGARLDVAIRWGEPVKAILEAAIEHGSELIVLGSKGAGGAPTLGHVARQVAGSAPCPVLLVSDPTQLARAELATGPQGPAVRRIMRSPVVTALSEETLSVIQERMASHGVHQLPVVDGERLVAIVSRRDIEPHAGYLGRTKVDAVMTHSPVTTEPAQSVVAVARLLIDQNVNALPVLDQGRLVGIVSKTDVLRMAIDLVTQEKES